MRLRGRALLAGGSVVAIAISVAVGCSMLTSYDGFTGASPVVECGKRWPGPPSGNGGGTMVLYGTMNTVSFFTDADGGLLGMDLDNLCTCHPDIGACRTSDGRNKPCDDDGLGIDNAGGKLIAGFFRGLGGGATPTLLGLDNAKFGMFVRVANYNGRLDDPDVEVSLYNVVGVNGATDGTGKAAFDGNDQFIVDQSGVLGDFGSQYVDTHAYVTGGVLVAQIDYPLRLVVPDITDAGNGPIVTSIPLKSAHLVGKLQIVGTGGLRMVSAQLVGRLVMEDVFSQLSRLGVCQNQPNYQGAKLIACQARDLPINPGSDGKDIPCDAVSFSLGLSIAPAKLTGKAAAPTSTSPCGQEAVDKCP